MIGLAAKHSPFFIRVNPNATLFTPHFNKSCDWNSGIFNLHLVPPWGFIGRVLSSARARSQGHPWRKMKGVSQASQFAIVIERGRAPAILEAQMFQEFDLLRGRISAKRTILQEF